MAYKVELIKIKKSYRSVIVDADNRREALTKARSMPEDEFDETENTEQVQWETKREWNLLDFLFNRV